MIEFLFSMFLVPLFPDLEDPQVTHAEVLMTVERRLNEMNSKPTLVTADLALESLDKAVMDTPDLPPITGRLFRWSSESLTEEAERMYAIGQSAAALRMTGLIQSSGTKVAILNDGKEDLVVGLGSYVLDAYRVTSLGQGQIVLSPVDSKSGGKRIELSLMPVITPEGVNK